MKKILLISSMLTWSQAYAETILYGKEARRVDLRSTSQTLLLFPQPPLSVSCQPESVKFELIQQESLSIQESSYLRSKDPESESKLPDDLLSRLLRAKPQNKDGSPHCSFILNDGDEISVHFNLREDISSPLLEFKHFTNEKKGTAQSESKDFKILRSLLKGEPLELYTEQRKYPREFYNGLGQYRIEYSGLDENSAGWRIRLTIKKDASFEDLAIFKSRDSLIRYSLTSPQKDHYEKGETVYQYLVTQPTLTQEELWKLVP